MHFLQRMMFPVGGWAPRLAPRYCETHSKAETQHGLSRRCHGPGKGREGSGEREEDHREGIYLFSSQGPHPGFRPCLLLSGHGSLSVQHSHPALPFSRHPTGPPSVTAPAQVSSGREGSCSIARLSRPSPNSDPHVQSHKHSGSSCGCLHM